MMNKFFIYKLFCSFGYWKHQQLYLNTIMLLGKYGGIAIGKAYIKSIGFDCGEFCSPLKNMGVHKFKKLMEDVRALGMGHMRSKWQFKICQFR